MTRRSLDLVTSQYVKDNLKVTTLEPVKGSVASVIATSLTGTVAFYGSASTGINDHTQIKNWAVLMGKSFGTHTMFDVIFIADGTYRITGFMYTNSGYGCLTVYSFNEGLIIFRRSGNAWL